MSLSKTIAIELADRLGDISNANGYITNCGLKVFRGRKRLDETHLPAIVIVEGDDRIDDRLRDKVKIQQRFMIEGHSPCDPDNPNDTAHDIIEDLKICIFGNGDRTFGGKVRDLNYMGRVISPREDGLSIVSGGIEIELTYAEELSAP